MGSRKGWVSLGWLLAGRTVLLAGMEVVERPTLAQVFRRFCWRYEERHGLSPEQRKIARCIQVCRTPALGGREYECDHCHAKHHQWLSCGNRHCPVCQARLSYAWLEAQAERLLPVPYFHVVFTLASELNPILAYNRRLLYQTLFATSSGTLQTFAADPRWLGAQLGFLGVLHTWGQNLMFHPHIHYIVPQGGIDAQGRWVAPRIGTAGKFLFPIAAVSTVFRARLLKALETLHRDKQLAFPDVLSESRFPDTLRIAASKRWEVYAQAPMAGPEQLLRYLGLYTHRAAISQGRLVRCDGQAVSFTCKNYRQGGRIQTMTLRGVEFVGRLLQHVLPEGFRKIRAYGFWANGAGGKKLRALQERWVALRLAMAGWLSGILPALGQEEETPTRLPELRCRRCEKGTMHYVRDVEPDPWDTS